MKNAMIISSHAGAAQVLSSLSVAFGLFAVTATIAFGGSDQQPAMPPIFSASLLVVLLAGLALGIFGVGWNKNPHQGGVMAAGILGICLNALFLLVLCGSLGAAAKHPTSSATSFGSTQAFPLHATQARGHSER